MDVESKEDIPSAVSKIGDNDGKLDMLVNTSVFSCPIFSSAREVAQLNRIVLGLSDRPNLRSVSVMITPRTK